MTATSFNPLAAACDLEAAGIERRQVEAIASQLRDAATAERADLATKTDLASEMRWMFSCSSSPSPPVCSASIELVCETVGFEVDDPARCRLQNIVTPTQSDGNYHGAPAKICPKSSTMPWI